MRSCWARSDILISGHGFPRSQHWCTVPQQAAVWITFQTQLQMTRRVDSACRLVRRAMMTHRAQSPSDVKYVTMQSWIVFLAFHDVTGLSVVLCNGWWEVGSSHGCTVGSSQWTPPRLRLFYRCQGWRFINQQAPTWERYHIAGNHSRISDVTSWRISQWRVDPSFVCGAVQTARNSAFDYCYPPAPLQPRNEITRLRRRHDVLMTLLLHIHVTSVELLTAIIIQKLFLFSYGLMNND